VGKTNKFLLTIIKPLLPKLKGWLGNAELLEGEVSKSVLLNVDKSNDELRIDIVALKVDPETKKLFINRVLDTISQDEIL